ncbi:MAG: T9SS type A sorting domain-containing protein [Balneola sp.]|nr:T9SS type A sorting domain-containing protein [Balneola sp.]
MSTSLKPTSDFFSLIALLSVSSVLLSLSFKVSSFEKHFPFDGPATGAKLSLGYLGDVRSYPNKDIPKTGLTQAFTRAKEMRVSKKSNQARIWSAMGPINIGGRTLALAIHPENPDTIFAGSASGGLWKSTTGGSGFNAWEYVRTGFPVLGVATIAIDPQDPDIMYIGTGESYGTEVNMPGIGPVRTTRGSYGIGILKSVDGGMTWQKSLDWSLDQRRAVQKIQINPLRSESIWAATTEGTYVSRDGGESWNLAHDIEMTTDVVINPSDTSVVFTANGGMGSLGHGIYRTKNAGESFEKMDLVSGGGPSQFFGKAVLDISESNPNIIMASIGNADGTIGATENAIRTWLMKSTNGGDTWSLEFASNDFYGTFQGWYSHAIAINPLNPHIVWAVGQPQVYYRSTNGGQNLAPVNAQPADVPDGNEPFNVYPYLFNWADHHDIVFHPTDPNTIYFINDGGIFRTTDGGSTIENCNSGYQTVQFYNGVSNSDTNGALMLGGLQDNNSIIYEGNLNWRRGWAGDGAWTALNQDNNNIAYLSAQFGQAVFSNDLFTESQFGDRSIHPGFDIFPSTETNFITPLIISPADNKTLYMGGEKILKSTNNGISWDITNNGNPLDGNAMSAMAASHQSVDVVYATSSPKATRANVYRTGNGGDTWFNITGILPDRFPTDLAVDPNNDQNIFITFGGFGSSHVFKSNDSGSTWTDIGTGLPDIPTWSVTVDPDFPDHIYVGNEIGVFQSLDGGVNWDNISGNLPDAVFAMELVISKSNRKLRLASHGNGAYEIPLVLAVSNEENENKPIPESFELEQNYPNPFNPSTTIKYTLVKNSNVNLEVYDITGKQLATLVNKYQKSGSYSVNFNAGNLSSGIYFYKISIGDKNITKKMTLLK